MQGIKKAVGKGLAAVRAVSAVGLALATATTAHAASPSAGGSGMPWEGPLNTILTSIQGPVARFGIIAAIVITGMMMAFGEHGGGFKKFMGIAFGGSIVIGVVALVSTLFGATF
ncbi:conjugal transfer protein TrbC [Pandoraea cepalis]|uniref:Conjugal transfer protein TrbC n=1 Tax=Pandoraea cepalis TaxID=2508294 RepID=A0AAW7MH10_9BURK|nr:TrbC/VirB2 family protein [Pandoraea cepalis]MDN4572050.1 conjugal transfer protein TrbC [Pandoraea cepalis]MDN4578896.1 conjugal transfer protein TrbC [Pandoraea cepalis]